MKMLETGAVASTSLPTTSLRDLAEIFYRRRWSFVLIVLATIIGTLGYIFLIRGDVYMAEAKLMVRLGQEEAPAPTIIADRSVMIGNQGGFAAGEMEIMQSRDLIGEVVDRVDLTEHPRPPPATLYQWVKEEARWLWRALRRGLDETLIWAGLKVRLTPREEAIEAISHSLLVDSPPNGNIFTARVVWPERGVPEALLNTLLESYFMHRSSLFQGSTATKFFTERRQETAAQLAAADKALADFEQTHTISNPDEQRSGLLKRLAEADSGVDSAALELQLVETGLHQLEAAQADGDKEVAAFAIAQTGSALQQTLATQIAAAASRWLAAQTTFGPEDLGVRRQRAEVLALAQMLADQLHATEAQRQAQLRLRETQRDAIRTDLGALQASLTKWEELKREVASDLRAHDFNDSKLNEAIGVAALEQARIGNVVVLQHPAEQATPVGMRKLTMLLFATGAGVLLGLCWIAVREFFDHRIYARHDVERQLHLRLLAAVPFDSQGFTGRAPKKPATEATLAHIATALAGLIAARGMRTTFVTAGAPGEGTTTVTAHVGRHLVALLGLRVLFIDLAEGEPRLTKLVGTFSNAPATLAIDDGAQAQGILEKVKAPWAIVMPRNNGLGALATESGLRALITAALAHFDLVLIDSPPYGSNAGSLLAMRVCSHALLVARAANLPSDQLLHICRDLEEHRIQMAGCVLNGFRPALPGWIEGVLR
jgi:polysaccharide biosynthesis transport protein